MPTTAREDLFLRCSDLQLRVKNLERELDEFKSGKRYLKLQEDHRLVVAGYIKEIQRLKSELAKANAHTVTVRNLWSEECEEIWKDHQSTVEEKNREIDRLKDKIWEIYMKCDEKVDTITEDYENRLSEKEAIIRELKAHLAHYEALLGRDSTNTGLPTSQTPIGKKKHIPNGRRNTGKKKGGQPGHEKHKLERPSAEEVTDEKDHTLNSDDTCPRCGSDDLRFTGEYEEKYEIDIEVKIKKTLHKYWLYECGECGEILRTGIEPWHRAECQYGPVLQAFALSMMNTANAAMNKVPLMISGMTNGEVMPSEGYVAKLQPRAAKGLDFFYDDLERNVITRIILYWDDTVVMADGKRICLRFYGDEKTAYYVAHEKKDMNGVIEDGILDALTEDTKVMHDHSSINYNPRFVFKNIECNAHLQRDLQKSADDTGHEALLEIKDLITKAIKDRNDLIMAGKTEYEPGYIEQFEDKLSELLEKARALANENRSRYSGPPERAVINRIKKYHDNYFAWMKDFSLPTTNNLSERALRGVKTKMKVSGQFASAKTANYYAKIRTYVETCRRNGINEMLALIRLCRGNPYTVEEIYSADSQ